MYIAHGDLVEESINFWLLPVFSLCPNIIPLINDSLLGIMPLDRPDILLYRSRIAISLDYYHDVLAFQLTRRDVLADDSASIIILWGSIQKTILSFSLAYVHGGYRWIRCTAVTTDISSSLIWSVGCYPFYLRVLQQRSNWAMFCGTQKSLIISSRRVRQDHDHVLSRS